MQVAPSPERLSVMLGLLLVILATLPRYVAEGLDTRLSLIGMAFVVVAVIAVIHWRMLAVEARTRLLPLLRRLGFAVLAGLAVMAIWHTFSPAWINWQVLLSRGVTLGLLLHVLGLWWKPVSNRT
ncbi:hypothetical protein GCM10007160_03640 [Litchfieldella qijiaojingensis]|uniref:Uncharacterized protein n=1 Tax=Litchfieldella qijiaojingensis TaxID=980347 RepID=A0ABQ2YEE2_9GAMM|nr:hypothetical protein [Halomonas qijiaojingensis]GGX79594.1 hypothetical protein GCM10007160_03640 [Halomonas qijiaojingensis]